MTYTLDSYFKAAKLKNPVPFAKYIEMDPEKLPMKHQVSGLNKLLRNDYYGLYDEPGTGKTMIVHAYGLYWVSEGQRVLCVMPPNLVYQFEEELYAIYRGSEKYVTSHILDDSPAKRRKLYSEWDDNDSWPQFLCMSYQMFQREYERLLGKYRVGIFDEAQALKNCESGIYKIVKQQWQEQKGGTSAVFMTGTPIHNEMIDAYCLIELTDPGRYASFSAFERIHCLYTKIRLKTPKRTKTGKMIRSFRKRVGYTSVPKLSENLYRNARRVLKRQIAEIKDPTLVEIPVKLETPHLTLYKKLVRERLLEMGEEMIIADNAQALRQKCLQIVTCPDLFVEEMKFKNNILKAGEEILDGIDLKETKVIMFANYQDSIRSLAKHFDKHNPALMYGQSDSDKNRKKFLNDDSCRLLIAHPRSAGAGFNFQGVCHTLIFMEPTGVPGDLKQCMARVDRWGQKNLVNVYILKALGTISPKATQEMQRKEGEAQQAYKDVHSFLEDFEVAA